MKLGKVAVGADGKVYFVSGLDGYVLHLLDGRHEVLSFEFPGRVRRTSTAGARSIPSTSASCRLRKTMSRWLTARSIAVICRQGQPSEVATVRQADVGGDWWGAILP